MFNESWVDLVQRINSDIAGIVKSQRVLREVNEEVSRRKQRPTEEDFIDEDAFGDSPDVPRIKDVDGVQIKIRKLHRRGISATDVKGADLIYEIEDRKFVLIQYKRPNSQGRLTKDGDQLQEQIDACPSKCPPHELRNWPTCGSWVCIKESAGEALYLPACETMAVFGSAASRDFSKFSRGLSAPAFQELFARCWIGARTVPVSLAAYVNTAVQNDHVVYLLSQQGTFGRW